MEFDSGGCDGEDCDVGEVSGVWWWQYYFFYEDCVEEGDMVWWWKW